jgi:molybdopterin-guanine dinucleotide biosynthesis protein A
MGRDKALVSLAGKPLIAYALDILRQAGLGTTIVGARSPLTEFAPVIEDAGVGPLGGICEGLAAMSSQLAVFTSVDMPLLPPSLISALIDHAVITDAAVTVASLNGFAQTFPAVVDRALLPALKAMLTSGQGGCFAALKAGAEQAGRPIGVVHAEVLSQAGQVEHSDGLPVALWFLNVNRPDDLARAVSIADSLNRVI